jgi:hypothetical protein
MVADKLKALLRDVLADGGYKLIRRVDGKVLLFLPWVILER